MFIEISLIYYIYNPKYHKLCFFQLFNKPVPKLKYTVENQFEY